MDKQINLDGKKKDDFVMQIHKNVRQSIENITERYANQVNKEHKKVVLEQEIGLIAYEEEMVSYSKGKNQENEGNIKWIN